MAALETPRERDNHEMGAHQNAKALISFCPRWQMREWYTTPQIEHRAPYQNKWYQVGKG